jgi:diguanylate cyclase (GGDEF)-like protein
MRLTYGLLLALLLSNLLLFISARDPIFLPYVVALAVAMLLLSFALGERISVMLRATGEALAARHSMVEILHRSEHDLEMRVATRTHALEQINAQLLQKERELEHIARHDPLTGLANRIVLRECFAQAAARARRSGCTVALLLVDLDGFKQINDRHGHAAGDKVLVTLAQRFLRIVRESDNIARIGGDEFVVVLQDLQERATLERVADRLLWAAGEPVELSQGRSVEVKASIGVAFYPQDASAMDQLLECADQAMYAAKAAGRNCWRMVESEVGERK